MQWTQGHRGQVAGPGWEQKVRSGPCWGVSVGQAGGTMTPGTSGEDRARLSPIHRPTNLFCELTGKPQTTFGDTGSTTGAFVTQHLQGQ